MLKGKKIVLGISGSIAAYKIASLASALQKEGADTRVIMTENACHFINPLVFDTLTGHRTYLDLFDRKNDTPVAHIRLGQDSNVILLAPASADLIAKAANGIADDVLTSTLTAVTCPVLVSPAMNTHMFESPAVQRNLKVLREFGWQILDPKYGHLACGVTGAGKMPEPEELLEALDHAVGHEKDLAGKKVLVSAGATREALDPVRFLTNYSTGKMGTALARAAAMRGASVTLVAGSMTVPAPLFVNTIRVNSAAEMYAAVTREAESSDVVMMAAAVADYRPAEIAAEKMKKTDGALTLQLERTEDILAALGAHKKEHQFLCGFAMETEELLKHAEEKRKKKHADLIVANSIREAGAGFGTDTNRVTLVSADGTEELPLLSKEETAHRILDRIAGSMGSRPKEPEI